MDLDVSESLILLITEFLAFMPKLLAALVIFLVTLYLSALLSRLLRRSMERQRADPALTLLLYHTVRWTVILVGGVAALRQVDFELTGFLAGIGILGFTLGFALQDISRNIVAGMLLLVQKPFDLGDLVEIEGYLGRVQSVDLRSTEILTLDGNNVLLPNGHVFTVPIINYSRESTRRMQLTIGVAFDSDLEVVRHTALQAIRTIPDVLNTPAPSLFFHAFNEFSIDFTVRFWIDTRVTDATTAIDPAIVAIQKAFDRKHIEIPYPIRTYMQAEAGEQAASSK
jgi:small conductance mechanosensitive channel